MGQGLSTVGWGEPANPNASSIGRTGKPEEIANAVLWLCSPGANYMVGHALAVDCTTCPMKARCCPRTPICKIARSIHEAARDVARRIATTPEYLRSRCERKKVEMLFAHLKRILKIDRLRLRGLTGATDEFTLAAAAQNLRRMAKLVPQGPPVTG
ncbi:SDR family oxidoreductase [Azotobacter armeniacus]